MSIVRAKTNTYGPATLDIQIEQGVLFYLRVELSIGLTEWDLAVADLDAHMSVQWSPGEQCVSFDIEKVVGFDNIYDITLPAATSLSEPFVTLPFPPKKTVGPTPFTLGDWVLIARDPSLTQTSIQLLTGTVRLLRDPCQM
jgi:hypothetical protein